MCLQLVKPDVNQFNFKYNVVLIVFIWFPISCCSVTATLPGIQRQRDCNVNSQDYTSNRCYCIMTLSCFLKPGFNVFFRAQQTKEICLVAHKITQFMPVLPLSHLLPASDVEAVAALLKRFLGLEELQRRRQQEDQAEYGEEEEEEEDSSDNSSESDVDENEL